MSENTDKDGTKGLKDAIKRIKREEALPAYDERARLILKGEITGDPLVDMFIGDEISQTAYEILQMRYTPSRKMYIEACLLATGDTTRIGEILGVDPYLIDVYQKVFYDVSHLDKLTKIKIVEAEQDYREQQFKMWALSQGIDFIAWRLGIVPRISPVDGLVSLYSDCFFKAKEAFHNNNSAEASKEGLKWAKQATDVARLLKAWVSDADEATRDIKIALKELTGDDVDFSSLDDLTDGSDIPDLDLSEEEDEDFPSIDDLKDES